MVSNGRRIASPQRDSFRPTVWEDVEPLDSPDRNTTTSWLQRITFSDTDGVEIGGRLAIVV